MAGDSSSERVWFYLLSEPGEQARLRAACKVTEKAWSTGHRVLVCASHAKAAADFDKLLWTFRQDSFVPHAMARDADEHDRVQIDVVDRAPAAAGLEEPSAVRREGPSSQQGTAEAFASSAPAPKGPVPKESLDVVVMLGGEAPEWALGATRIAAFVGGDDAAKASGRDAFRRWQALGERPHTVKL